MNMIGLKFCLSVAILVMVSAVDHQPATNSTTECGLLLGPDPPLLDNGWNGTDFHPTWIPEDLLGRVQDSLGTSDHPGYPMGEDDGLDSPLLDNGFNGPDSHPTWSSQDVLGRVQESLGTSDHPGYCPMGEDHGLDSPLLDNGWNGPDSHPTWTRPVPGRVQEPLGTSDHPGYPMGEDHGLDSPLLDNGLNGPDSPPTWSSQDSLGRVQEPRATGGDPVDDPYRSIVSVQYNGAHRCFGTVLTDLTVLVPARCLDSIDPRTLKVVYALTKQDGEGRRTRGVADFKANSGWDESGQKWTHDEAVLMVDRYVTLGCHIEAVTLADDGSVSPPQGTKGITYGWRDNSQSKLVRFHVKVADHKRCNQMHDDMVTDDMICATGPDGEDACESDLGAPLFMAQGDTWVQTGFNIRGPQICALPYVPVVYWRPSRFILTASEELTRGRCGIQNLPRLPGGPPRVGGWEAPPHAWPWVGFAHIHSMGKAPGFQYGAVLLNRYYAATNTFVEPGNWLVLGAHNRHGHAEWYKIVEVIRHSSNTITLVRLDRPVQFNKNIAPVCLPNDGDVTPVDRTCMTAGWGWFDGDHKLHDKLHEVYRTPCEFCCGKFSLHKNTPGPAFCDEAGPGGGSHYDMGGPLMCKSKDNDVWTLYGIMIGWYHTPSGLPVRTVYGRVTAMLSWIKNTITYPGWNVSLKKFDGH